MLRVNKGTAIWIQDDWKWWLMVGSTKVWGNSLNAHRFMDFVVSVDPADSKRELLAKWRRRTLFPVLECHSLADVWDLIRLSDPTALPADLTTLNGLADITTTTTPLRRKARAMAVDCLIGADVIPLVVSLVELAGVTTGLRRNCAAILTWVSAEDPDRLLRADLHLVPRLMQCICNRRPSSSSSSPGPQFYFQLFHVLSVCCANHRDRPPFTLAALSQLVYFGIDAAALPTVAAAAAVGVVCRIHAVFDCAFTSGSVWDRELVLVQPVQLMTELPGLYEQVMLARPSHQFVNTECNYTECNFVGNNVSAVSSDNKLVVRNVECTIDSRHGKGTKADLTVTVDFIELKGHDVESAEGESNCLFRRPMAGLRRWAVDSEDEQDEGRPSITLDFGSISSDYVCVYTPACEQIGSVIAMHIDSVLQARQAARKIVAATASKRRQSSSSTAPFKTRRKLVRDSSQSVAMLALFLVAVITFDLDDRQLLTTEDQSTDPVNLATQLLVRILSVTGNGDGDGSVDGSGQILSIVCQAVFPFVRPRLLPRLKQLQHTDPSPKLFSLRHSLLRLFSCLLCKNMLKHQEKTTVDGAGTGDDDPTATGGDESGHLVKVVEQLAGSEWMAVLSHHHNGHRANTGSEVVADSGAPVFEATAVWVKSVAQSMVNVFSVDQWALARPLVPLLVPLARWFLARDQQSGQLELTVSVRCLVCRVFCAFISRHWLSFLEHASTASDDVSNLHHNDADDDDAANLPHVVVPLHHRHRELIESIVNVLSGGLCICVKSFAQSQSPSSSPSSSSSSVSSKFIALQELVIDAFIFLVQNTNNHRDMADFIRLQIQETGSISLIQCLEKQRLAQHELLTESMKKIESMKL